MQVDMEGPRNPEHGHPPSGRSEASSVGALLRAARMRQGHELQDVSGALRVRFVYLQAIEEGRFGDLPGPTYAVGFVRAYADHLGLDVDEVVARFRSEVSTLTERSELRFPAPVPESRVPSGALLLISVLLAAVAYGGWYYLTMGNRAGIELVSEVPQRLAGYVQAESGEQTEPSGAGQPQAPESEAGPVTETLERMPPAELRLEESPWREPVPEERVAAAGDRAVSFPAEPRDDEEAPTPVSDSVEPETAEADAVADTGGLAPVDAGILIAREGAAVSDGTAADEDTAAGDEPAAESEIEDAFASETAAPEQVAVMPVAPSAPEPLETAAAPAQVFGKANADARIVIRAKNESWVQVRDGRGGLVLTRMLRPGDSYRVPNQSGLMLLTGNAGALEIFVDGRLAPPIGPGGAIRRDVALDADRLLAGTAVEN
jgi:cytoskeletal protein RodZ